ncbi:MAG: rRNA pseudouridine synthase [Chloroflexi bacterium]|nr:rRNA pseudouridine synthase [Chloroflexota bacterium]
MERLHKVLAHAGVASRRKAEAMILARRVSVNGDLVTILGTQVDPGRDHIQVDGVPIRGEAKKYIVLYKPKGYLSDLAPSLRSGQAPRGKPRAVDLIPLRERLYPVGRLDAESEGLLFLTNDGALAQRLMHPRYQHEKEYLAMVRGEIDDRVLAQLCRGVWRAGERYRAERAHRVGAKQKYGTANRGQAWVKIILREGKKREIREMCAAVGHPVLRLIRVRIGSIHLGNLRAGNWRELNAAQVADLKQNILGQAD